MENIRAGNEYSRYLSPLDVWTMAFGCTIGWRSFLLPGSIFLPVAGPAGTLIAMVISVVVMAVIGFSFSYLMQNRPGTGGVYAYTRDAFGRTHAFLCAWFLSLSYLAILFINATSMFLVIRLVFGERLQSGYVSFTFAGDTVFAGEIGASIIALAVVGLLFINAKPFLQRLQTKLALVLLVCVALIGAVCLLRMDLGSLKDAYGIQGASRAFAVFSVVMVAPRAFVGFEVISLETAHFDFKIRRSRWLILISILLSGFVYLCLTVISISSVPDGYASWQGYIADLSRNEGLSAIPTFYAARNVMGRGGLIIMAIAAMAAILTGIIAAYRAAVRLLLTMTEDHILSERFSDTNTSIIFVMVVSILISIFGRSLMENFMELVSFGAVICFGYACASACIIAKKEGKPLNVWIGALGTAVSVMFAIVQFIPKFTAVEIMDLRTLLMLGIWCLLGVLFYLFTTRRRGAERS